MSLPVSMLRAEVVTHLLGAGHLSRAAVLARACQAAGHEVKRMSGGVHATHFETGDLMMVQLPAVTSDGLDFQTVLDESDSVMNPEALDLRVLKAVEPERDFVPDVLVTELFLFGRRQEAWKPRPKSKSVRP